MKTNRTLLSIMVFFCVFWISILIGSYSSSQKTADETDNPSISVENPDSHTIYKTKINTLYNYNHDVASAVDRLYQSDESDADKQAKATVLQQYDNIINNGISADNISEDEISEDDLFEDSISEVVTSEEGISDDITSEEGISDDNNSENESSAVPSLYSDIGISIASTYVNIRDKASTDGEIKGKLYKDSAARILDSVEDWYYVESGSVKGYLKKDYLKTGIPDNELIEKYGTLRIKVNTDGLNVREMPAINSKKLTVIYNNEIYPVIGLINEWVKVDITDDRIIGYVNREYVELLVDFKKAVSKEEEEQLRKLQEEERIKKETEIKYRDAMDYTQEELKLLACLVHSEAGDQSYEGKLAVANIVINRVKSSKYPNTIYKVIYQPGQFTVAKNGSLSKQLDKYDSYSSTSQLLSIKAARAALEGANNIGNRLYFHTYKLAKSKGYDQKKNCVRIEDHLFW